jgi:hypothetical protein
MKLKQLSIFLENRPGALSAPCRALAAAGVNLITLSLADSQQFGILRVVVRDWAGAQQILEASGCVVKVTEVVAVEVADRPGGLAELLEVFEHARLNVEYMYAFTLKQGDRGLLVFRFDDPDAAVEALRRAKVVVVDEVELFRRLGA